MDPTRTPSASARTTTAPAVTRTTRGPTVRLVAVLAALSAAAPFATDMYVPGFPGLARDLGTSAPAAQLSLTAFLIGVGAGQLVLGPLSDVTGRRRVLLAGTAAFLVTSLACALAPDIAVLDVARLLQGLAGAAGMVVARAVITDRYEGAEAARRFATVSMIVFTAPVLAPLAGGLLTGAGGWRLVFLVLAAFGALLLAGVAAWVPETLPPGRRRTGGLRATATATAGLLRDRRLVGHLLTLALGGAALFAYISGSSFVFQNRYGLTPVAYGLVFAVNAVGLFLAGGTFGRLAGRVRTERLLVAGAGVALAAAVVLAVSAAAGVDRFPLTWACCFGLTAGLGLLLPATVTATQERGRRAPGATSGLVGAGQFTLAAVAAPLTGTLGVSGAGPMAAVVLVTLLAATAAHLTLTRRG